MTLVTTSLRTEHHKVVIVGSGPAGLSAALELAQAGVGPIVVLEREEEFGGAPRYALHRSYGASLRRLPIRGSTWVQELLDQVQNAGVELRAMNTVTGWSSFNTLDVSSPQGRYSVQAEAIVLATGAHEAPRAAQSLPGDRMAGVYSVAQLLQMSNLQQRPIGERAVVMGSSRASWAAVSTLNRSACQAALMVTPQPRVEINRALGVISAVRYGLPTATSTQVTRIVGKGRVEAVELLDLRTGQTDMFVCDTVVLSGQWRSESDLVRLGALPLNPSTRGPLIDSGYRTERSGIYAMGDVVHPGGSMDQAILDGRHVAATVLGQFQGDAPPSSGARLVAAGALSWVSPGVLESGAQGFAGRDLLARGHELVKRPRVVVSQAGQEISTTRLRRPIVPGRIVRIPPSVLDGVSAQRGEIEIRVS